MVEFMMAAMNELREAHCGSDTFTKSCIAAITELKKGLC